MQLIDHKAILAFGDDVICLDIRSSDSYRFHRMNKGVKIPYDKMAKRVGSIAHLVHLPIVVFSSNCPSRCNRAKIAENELIKAGFNQIFGIEGGIIRGWTMTTKSSDLPGIEI